MDLKIPVPKMLLKRHTYHLWKPWRRRSWRNSVSRRTGGTERPTGTDQPNQRRLASPLCWPVFTGTLDIPCSGVEQKVRSNRDCEDTKWRLYGLLTYCCTMKMIKKMICKQYEEVKSDCSSRRCHFVFFYSVVNKYQTRVFAFSCGKSQSQGAKFRFHTKTPRGSTTDSKSLSIQVCFCCIVSVFGSL